MIKYFLTFLLSVLIAFTYAQDKVEKSQEPEFNIITVKDFILDYRVENDNLVAKVSYPTEGWVAIGFNPVKKMKGANFIIGCNKEGKEIVEDHYGVNPVSHKADTLIGGKNNLIESSCTEEDGRTTLSFTIPLNSGDEKDGVLKKGKENKVIFAAGKKDDLGTKHSVLAKEMIKF